MTMEEVHADNADHLTCVSAAKWMLKHGLEVFSRREREDGVWWIDLVRVGEGETRFRGEGMTLGAALEQAFAKLGIAGLEWKLHKLEDRIWVLTPKGAPEPKRNRACPHGVSGGRCRQCV